MGGLFAIASVSFALGVGSPQRDLAWRSRRSDGADEVEFVVVNFFESIESVRLFAGDDYSTPVFEPEARLLLSRIEPIARHYEVRASTI